MPTRLVIFDFDGTLADSFPWFLSHFNDLAEKFRFRKLGPGDLEEARGLGTRALLKYFGIPFWKVPAIAREMRRRAAVDQSRIPLFPHTPELLKGLREAGFQVAIVTSNAEESVRGILGPENCLQVDHFSCGASLFGKAKKLKSAAVALSISPAEAIYIGDETRDIDAARKVGMRAGSVAWGYARPEALRALQPNIFFERMDAIVPQLKSHKD